MIMFFFLFMIIVMMQRLVELIIAKRNEKWMKERGGVELGQDHYKLFIYLHVLFFISLFVEVAKNNFNFPKVSFLLLFLFLITQIGRIWCINTLGKFWNTKIIVLPKVSVIRSGPYKFLKHPNYVIVGLELILIPFIFGAYVTALLFPIFHLLLLKIRIPAEEKALMEE